MGGRGSFRNVSLNDFTFNSNGKTYFKIGEYNGIDIIARKDHLSVKAPEYSHSPNKIYAVVQNGKLKHLTFYDKNHNQAKSIDLGVRHGGMDLHYHLYLDHTTAYPATTEDKNLIKEIKRKFNLKWRKNIIQLKILLRNITIQ